MRAVACYKNRFPSPVTTDYIEIPTLRLKISMVLSGNYTGALKRQLTFLVSACMEVPITWVEMNVISFRRQNYGAIQALSSIQVDSMEMASSLEAKATVAAFTQAMERFGPSNLKMQSVTSNGVQANGSATKLVDAWNESNYIRTRNLIIILSTVLGGVLIIICIIAAIWWCMRNQRKEWENNQISSNQPAQAYILPNELVFSSSHAAHLYELGGNDGSSVAPIQV